ncbi:MAG: OmpA family protein, partial [Candidatus Kapabacteria bacterium]|nr:OmpA family protein [Candidatus Kapabacteria bacterium]
LITMLSSRPTLRVAIEGHTDDRGSDSHNMTLSQERAEAVRTYLVQKGISPDRLSAKGFGKGRPLTKSAKDVDRQRNRRVDFRIVSV